MDHPQLRVVEVGLDVQVDILLGVVVEHLLNLAPIIDVVGVVVQVIVDDLLIPC